MRMKKKLANLMKQYDGYLTQNKKKKRKIIQILQVSLSPRQRPVTITLNNSYEIITVISVGEWKWSMTVRVRERKKMKILFESEWRLMENCFWAALIEWRMEKYWSYWLLKNLSLLCHPHALLFSTLPFSQFYPYLYPCMCVCVQIFLSPTDSSNWVLHREDDFISV